LAKIENLGRASVGYLLPGQKEARFLSGLARIAENSLMAGQGGG
jgi:hypothetical protein